MNDPSAAINQTIAFETKIAAHLQSETPPAVVLASDRAHGLAVVRSLGRQGIKVVAINQTLGPGRHSRFALNVDIPPSLNHAGIAQMLLRVGEPLAQKPFLIPTNDQFALLIVRNREALSRYYSFMALDTATAELIADKRSQYRAFEAAGVPMPLTFQTSSFEEVEQASRQIPYPCIIKPSYSDLWRAYRLEHGLHQWSKLAVVQSRDELLAIYLRMKESGLDFLLQEFVPGGDDQIFNVFMYLDQDSNVIAALARQKLRQWPVGQGAGCYLVSRNVPEVIRHATHLLQSLDYVGLADVEFKRDARDGEYKLMEINIRSATHVSMAIDLGMDIPYIAYRHAVGLPVNVDPHYKEGRYWLDIGQDARSFLFSRTRGGVGLLAWLRSILRARSFAYFAPDDLKPWVARVWELVRDSRDLLRQKPYRVPPTIRVS